MPYWEDDAPRLSPDGTTVAYSDDGHVWLVPAEGGPPRKLLEASGPTWVDATRLIVSVERGDTTRLAVVDIADPWPRRLAASEDTGDEDEAAVSPDGAEVAFTFYPARRPQPLRDPRRRPRHGRHPRGHGHAGHARPPARRGRPTGARSRTPPSAAASTSCTSWAATATATGS